LNLGMDGALSHVKSNVIISTCQSYKIGNKPELHTSLTSFVEYVTHISDLT